MSKSYTITPGRLERDNGNIGLSAHVRNRFSRFRVGMQVFAIAVSTKLRDDGVFVFCGRGLRRLFLEICWVCGLPVAGALHLSGVRRLAVKVEHIGHLAEEINTLLKEVNLGLLPKNHWFVLAPPRLVSNSHLLDYWKQHVRVIQHPLACRVLLSLTRRYLAVSDVSRYTADYFRTQEIYRVCRLWRDRPPILKLTTEDEEWGAHMLECLGMQRDQWFVCVHVREGGFLPHNEIIQAHRNADVMKYVDAMQEIVRRGGVCIRMGDTTMKHLPPIPNVIDYAHHPLKSARLDVILAAKSRFFLGCTSGLAFVATAFGVPTALANMIPIAARGIGYRDISIPKLIRRHLDGGYLSLQEIFALGAANYFFSHQYSAAGLDVVENESMDILDMVLDMFDLLEGKLSENAEDAMLLARYENCFKPGDYGYGSVSGISRRFLRRRRELLFGAKMADGLVIERTGVSGSRH